jgi:hypothetical protein
LRATAKREGAAAVEIRLSDGRANRWCRIHSLALGAILKLKTQ